LPATVQAAERLLVLAGEDRIAYYRIDGASNARHVKTYGRADLPGAFPARRLEVSGGNRVTTYDGQGDPVGRLVFDGPGDRLVPYGGEEGSRAAAGGRILVGPALDESFRQEGSLYAKSRDARRRLQLEAFGAQAGRGRYVALFALDGRTCGVRADGIECLAADAAPGGAGKAEVWLHLPGARLTGAAVSPWQELFLADASGPRIRRFQVQGGKLAPSGEIAEKGIGAPSALDFSADGELFAAASGSGASEVVRWGFAMDDFIHWRPVVRERIRVDGGAATSVALLRPVGYVISEKTHPPVKLPRQDAGGHFGISQSVPISPDGVSESAVLAVVEYEPGGHTPVHLHPNMEQMEVVLAGRALWEVGEMEREVGPGDVIFCPRNVKHGYKVLGDQPFRFFQIEWREWKLGK
jgi:quercetin dioxygenase-like cupin family protein